MVTFQISDSCVARLRGSLFLDFAALFPFKTDKNYSQKGVATLFTPNLMRLPWFFFSSRGSVSEQAERARFC